MLHRWRLPASKSTRITENLVGTLDLDTVLSELCRRARELVRADRVSVRLPAPTTHGFRFAVDFASALKSRPDRPNSVIYDLSSVDHESGRRSTLSLSKGASPAGFDRLRVLARAQSVIY